MIAIQTAKHTFDSLLSILVTTAPHKTGEVKLHLTRTLFDKVDNLYSATKFLIAEQHWLIESNSKEIERYRKLLDAVSSVTDRSLEVCEATDIFVQSLKPLELGSLISKCLRAISFDRKRAGWEEKIDDIHQNAVSDMFSMEYACDNIPSKGYFAPLECHYKFFQTKAKFASSLKCNTSWLVDKMCNLIFGSLRVIQESDYSACKQLPKLADEMYAQSLCVHDEAKKLIELIEEVTSKRRIPFVVTDRMRRIRLKEIEAYKARRESCGHLWDDDNSICRSWALGC